MKPRFTAEQAAEQLAQISTDLRELEPDSERGVSAVFSALRKVIRRSKSNEEIHPLLVNGQLHTFTRNVLPIPEALHRSYWHEERLSRGFLLMPGKELELTIARKYPVWGEETRYTKYVGTYLQGAYAPDLIRINDLPEIVRAGGELVVRESAENSTEQTELPRAISQVVI